jgi:thiol-disulfide isomerase/thioredoxin
MTMRSAPGILLLAALVVGCAAPPAGEPSTRATQMTTPTAGPSDSPRAVSPSPSPLPSGSIGATAGAASGSPAPSDDPLLATELRDVRTDETFTLASLAADGPVIVETMAIWCTNCRAQMHEVTAAHELADFHSVSIDVEPGEAPADLAEYAEREGFDWPFVVADAGIATQLRERFGPEVLFPPGMPKLLVRPDGTVELLPLGDLLSARDIAALVGG